MPILTADMQRVVREQRLGYVATVSADGTPNLSPKGTLTVWDGDHLVFADIQSPGTVANLRRSPEVEINVVDPFVRKGYRFKGTAVVLLEGALFEQIRDQYERDGLFDAPRRIRAIVLVRVEQARPLISPAYQRDVTEEQVRAQWEEYYAQVNSQKSQTES